ncbi:MAG: hypothetical protein ABFS46_08245 [Myxococcota bacterium]
MRRSLALLGALSLLLGCATIDPWGHQRSLEDAQRSYTQMVRWGDFLKASAFVDPELADGFLDDAESLSTVRFTDYEIGALDMKDDKASATVRVEYQAYHTATLLEGTLRETQDWYFEGGKWRVRPTLAALSQSLLGP